MGLDEVEGAEEADIEGGGAAPQQRMASWMIKSVNDKAEVGMKGDRNVDMRVIVEKSYRTGSRISHRYNSTHTSTKYTAQSRPTM